MKLSLFKVQNFRSIWNSGWVSCQDVTAIAGVNEAGKSNLLKALWKLKPAFRIDNRIVHSDLPRDKFDEIMDSDELPVFITAKFRLEPNDLAQLRKHFPNIKPFDSCLISRTLSGKYIIEVPVNVPEAQKDKLYGLLIRLMPGFIYYSNYGNLDSNIYLPQMLAKFNKSGVNALSTTKRRTIKLLLMYIGITPEMLANDLPTLSKSQEDAAHLSSSDLRRLMDTQDKYKRIFADAGERLSYDFNRWWHQGKYKFEFTFDGDNLKIWVTDDKGNRAPLEERSVGMQWFLSFFLVFSLESEFFYTNTVLLLDESGMTLHSLAQRDLVHFFEKLSKKNQIIYSTHSSFMLPTEHLNRTKVVYKDDKGHSIVSNDLSVNSERSNEDSLFPIESAVGIDISRSILNGSNAVIVMSNADQNYLNIIRNYLVSTGKYQNFDEVVFVATGDNGIDGVAQILGKGRGLPNVLLSADAHGEDMRKYLYKHAYSNASQKVFCLDQFGKFQTIEDVFPYEIYAYGAGNYLAGLLGDDFEIDTARPLLEQIREYATNNNLRLPVDFREELSRRVKTYIQKNYKSVKLSRNTRKLWEDLITNISSER